MFLIKSTKAMLFLSESDSNPPERSFKRFDECDIIVIQKTAAQVQDYIFDNKLKDCLPQTLVLSTVLRNESGKPVFFAVIGKDSSGEILTVVPLNTKRADETTVNKKDILVDF